MTTAMRTPTLQTLGLGNVLDIFANGKLPVEVNELVEKVFGKPSDRGSLVISGANGIVGAGKSMQIGARLQPFGVPIVALDFPGAADGLGKQYSGLVKNFGSERAGRIVEEIVKLNYDGRRLPAQLSRFKPKFLLEAIPEILEVKKNHYRIFREAFPGIEIRSVTSGFPASQLGVGIAHPAFPHQINKVWEIVEPKPSAVTQLFWALGLIPVPVSDHWSFVLDVIFCGVMLGAIRYNQLSNMPFWKIDKYVRKLLGPNPFRAHDVIGAKGANFLTWSCLHHLSEHYGDLFKPAAILDERMETGQNWYPLNHFRPLVNWSMSEAGESEFNTRILGPLFQMTSLLLFEKRSHPTHINAIGELCAQFRHGVLALTRSIGYKKTKEIVKEYHALHPGVEKPWHPEVFEKMPDPEWQQLYVNAEHDGKVGLISINRESYNADVDAELNRAIDWLKKESIERAIITGDFHLSTQMVGADIGEFFPALTNVKEGHRISFEWSKTARRLNDEFKVSVAFINGKRCLGGFLELLTHCHFLVCVEGTTLGMPEVTLPVVPGMEGCHWMFRKSDPRHWPKLGAMFLTGTPVKAEAAVGWLIDFAGTLNDSLRKAWEIAAEKGHGLPRRELKDGALKDFHLDTGSLAAPESALIEAGRKAILDCIKESCSCRLSEALDIQANHSAAFMSSAHCLGGKIGGEFKKSSVA